MNEKLSEQFQSREKKPYNCMLKILNSESMLAWFILLLPLVQTKPRIQIMFPYHYTAYNSAFITSNV